MKPTLSNTEHLDLLTCIEDLHRCRLLADFPEHTLRALERLLPSSLSAFNEVNVPRKRIVAITSRPLPDHADLKSIWERYAGQHPLVNYTSETGDGQAMKISDFLSTREFHRLDLYQSFYRHLEAEDQMCVTIRSDNGFILALAFNRSRRDFSESDRLKLNFVRPHLLQAYANLEELSGHLDEKNDLKTALRETGHGLVALNAAGDVAHATPGAVECLARYFPSPAVSKKIPRLLAEWLRSSSDQPFTASTSTSRLIVRRPKNAGRDILLLAEENERGRPTDPRLTSREHEVLGWIVEGKTNAEIAKILGIAAGTVKQHVENILAKLGVDNRTAATACARQASHFPPTRPTSRA